MAQILSLSPQEQEQEQQQQQQQLLRLLDLLSQVKMTECANQLQ